MIVGNLVMPSEDEVLNCQSLVDQLE